MGPEVRFAGDFELRMPGSGGLSPVQLKAGSMEPGAAKTELRGKSKAQKANKD
jgi:hypothetical protein